MSRWVAALCAFAVLIAASACRETGVVRVNSIKFKGVKGVNESALSDALATRASSRFFWGKKRFFNRSQFETDLKRITAFYSDHGFPRARVTNFDVKLNDKQDAVNVTLTIDEGDPVIVTAIDYQGFDVLPPRHLSSVKSRAPIRLHKPRDKAQVLTTREMVLNELRDHGYPYATVRVDEDDGPDGLQSKLTFVGEPGKLARFGPTTVQGNETVSDRVILREVTFKPGELYSRSSLQNVQRRLYGMSLFQFVNVEPTDVEQQPDVVPTLITVAEGPHQRVNFSVGYGTEEQARLEAEYHKLNFLGGAREAGARVRWSSLDRGVQLDFTQPYVFDPHMSFKTIGQQWYAYTPAYNSRTTGATGTLTYRLREQTTASFSITSEYDASSIAPNVQSNPALRVYLIALGLNPETGEQRGQLNSFKIEGHHSTADNLLNPTRGYQLTLSVEEAGRLLPGTFKFTQVTGDARHYLPISQRFSWANRAQFGNLSSPENDPAAVPFSRKYFLGGATSVRGWGRYELSPLAGGEPVGGNSMFAFSSEAREIIRGSFGVVLFYDTGNVWANSWAVNLSDLRHAVGSGLRYMTPVGPLRFDFGYQLNPIPGLLVNGTPQTRRWRVHFSVGQAF